MQNDIFFARFYRNWQKLLLSNSDPYPKILLLISGGSDSICLLHCLKTIYQQANLLKRLNVLHVNYQLRGKDAKQDALFVQTLCQQLSIKYYEHTIDLAKQKGNIQALARKVRYQYAQHLQEKEYLDFILTAHHLNDELETIFYKILQGKSVFSLIADKSLMAKANAFANPFNDFRQTLILKPLMIFTKVEISNWLMAKDIPFREDQSNQDTKYERNKIRLELLPKLTEHFPDWQKGIQLFVENLQNVQKSWDKLLQQQSHFICKDKNIFFSASYFKVFTFSEHTTLLHYHLKKHYPEWRFSHAEIREIAKKIYYQRDKQKTILLKEKVCFDYSYGLFSLRLDKNIAPTVSHRKLAKEHLWAKLQWQLSLKKESLSIRSLHKDDVFYRSQKNIFKWLKKKKIPAQLRQYFYTLSAEDVHYCAVLLLPKEFSLPKCKTTMEYSQILEE